MTMPNLPTLFLDLDDILAAYTVRFIDFAATCGVTIEWNNIQGSFSQMGLPIELFDGFYQSDYFKAMPRVKGAKAGVAHLSEYFNLAILTSRPIELKTPTLEWLSHNFPNYSHKVIFSRNKGEVCKTFEAWGLVDDQIRYAEQVENSFVLAYPWNRDWRGKKAFSWDSLAYLIIADLKEEYARKR